MTEQEAKRIADALERIASMMERSGWFQPTVPLPHIYQPFDPNRCGYCGGYHGSNVMCPKLAPTAGSTKP